jgi:uncharacterized protein YaiE (UPF0345 family)
MEKDKQYKGAQFNANVLKEAQSTFKSLLPEEVTSIVAIRKVTLPGDETWTFDSDDESLLSVANHRGR